MINLVLDRYNKFRQVTIGPYADRLRECGYSSVTPYQYSDGQNSIVKVWMTEEDAMFFKLKWG